MPADSDLDFRIVDLSDQRLEARVWRPALDAFDRPAGAKVYHDLIDSVSLRLGRDEDGTPRIAVREADAVSIFRVPSTELVDFLDRWALRRHRRMLTDTTISEFVRIVRARVGSHDFEPDPPFLGPDAEWNETRSPRISDAERDQTEFEALLDAVSGILWGKELVLRASDLGLRLQVADTEIFLRLARHRDRLLSAGFLVRTIPSTIGPVVMVLRRPPPPPNGGGGPA